MIISTDSIKQLRDETGISVMQCRKALEEAGGDGEKAKIILRKQGASAAAKKGDRTLGAGAVASYIHGWSVGAMVELSCETDFVARNEEFKALAYDIAMQVAATNPEFRGRADVDETAREKAREVFATEIQGKPKELQAKILEGKLTAYFADKILLEQPFIKDETLTITSLIERAIQKFGEKIEIARFVRYSVSRQ